jgi:hypothetical protein
MRKAAQKMIHNMGGPLAHRATRQDQGRKTWAAAQRRSSRQAAPETYDDYEDQEIDTRPGVTRSRPPRSGGWHPVMWVALTLIGVVLFFIVTTSGLAWWATHMTDPGQYAGQLHGTIITGVFGGGDGQDTPSKLIGWNNGGRIQIIKITANDPAHSQIIAGPNLTKLDGFPDPRGAVVDLQAGDFNGDGNQDLKVTIYATVYDAPFHRYNIPYILYGNGKGGLKPSSAA